jgi:hypothetical protein
VTADDPRPAGEPVKGRCGTCDWPTNRLPCAYCAAAARPAASGGATDGERECPGGIVDEGPCVLPFGHGGGCQVASQADGGLRARARSIVANWRVNFGRDEDEVLVNMIETALLADAAKVQRVRELADLLAGPPTIAENGAVRREIADRIRRALDHP